jgi:hypothetical protein
MHPEMCAVAALLSTCAATAAAEVGRIAASEFPPQQTATATAIIYDAAGVHPQCSEGDYNYMAGCVLPSDYFSYILSAHPVLSTRGNCSSLGFTFVSTDPIFSGFRLYWKGGAPAFSAWSKGFGAGHAQLGVYLAEARGKNPACGSPAPPSTVPSAPGVMTYYDTAGALPQCSEGPASYMLGCVERVDMVAYLKSSAPKLIAGAHCSTMGFKYASMDNIFPQVKLYWKASGAGGLSIQQYFGAYFANHTRALGYLNATRDATPACHDGP